jgi:hypothetical protein
MEMEVVGDCPLAVGVYLLAVDVYLLAVDVYLLAVDVYLLVVDVYLLAVDVYLLAVGVCSCVDYLMGMEVVGDCPLVARVYLLAVGVCSGVIVHSNCRRQRHRHRSIGGARPVVTEAGGRKKP